MRTRPGKRLRGAAGMATLALVAASGVAALASEPTAAAAPPSSACQLGNGVKHVISLVFDNVHFFRDNPNVPSDLEQMPHLLNFLEVERHGAVQRAHAADRAHRRRQPDDLHRPVRRPARPAGDATPTRPTTRTARPTRRPRSPTGRARSSTPRQPADGRPRHARRRWPTRRHRPGHAGATDRQTPAPWVPFTRAGCSVGDFSTANMVLENTTLDIPTVFGAELARGRAATTPTPTRSRTPRSPTTSASAVHCAQGDAICADAQAVKYGQTTPSPTAVADTLPTEPGGYTRLPGAVRRAVRRAAARRGHAEPDPQRLPGHQRGRQPGRPERQRDRRTPFSRRSPGFPGFSPTADAVARLPRRHAGERHPGDLRLHLRPARAQGRHQRLHHRDRPPRPASRSARATAATSTTPRPTTTRSRRSSSGSPRTASRRPTPLFVISAEENDQFAGANVGRATQPTPAGCDGVTVPCNYATGQIGELQANIKGLLSTHREREHAVRHRAAGRVDLRARAAGRRRPDACGSSSATPPR